jgi:hypothetical protein
MLRSTSYIYEGGSDELLAVRELEIDKYLIVVYKEVDNEDGFVITAFLTSKIRQLERRTKIWPRQK